MNRFVRLAGLVGALGVATSVAAAPDLLDEHEQIVPRPVAGQAKSVGDHRVNRAAQPVFGSGERPVGPHRLACYKARRHGRAKCLPAILGPTLAGDRKK